MVSRAALRVLPILMEPPSEHSLLAAFRAVAVSWAADQYPGRTADLRSVANVAAHNVARDLFVQVAVSSEANEYGVQTSEYAARAVSHAADAVFLPDAAANALRAATRAGGIVAHAAANADARMLESVTSRRDDRLSTNLAAGPLWPETIPVWVIHILERCGRELLRKSEDWEVWLNWYKDRLSGHPSLGEQFDIAVATLANEFWQQGPKAVNARIKELIAEHTLPEPIPAQGAGPHFGFGETDKIALAPPIGIDADGNDLGRLRQQLPLVREAADDLAGRLNPNEFSELTPQSCCVSSCHRG
jgi:hypothetical protein